MSKFAGFSFPCQHCRGRFYALTEEFRPEPPMRGDYVALLPQYGPSGHNWYDFPHTPWTIGDNVACVQCGEPIRIEYVHELFKKFEAEKALQHGNEGGVCLGSEGEALEPGGQAVSRVDAGSSASSVADSGLYGEVDIEDGLLQTVLRMTASGETQAMIAETCGISVYRVRKLQNGELK